MNHGGEGLDPGHSHAKGLDRMDVVTHLDSAIETYQALDPVGQKQLLGGGSGGRPERAGDQRPGSNAPVVLYLGGSKVSALQVACILYAGIQLLLPGQDAGIDLARKNELAKDLAGTDSDG